jgi:hypothetical protein
VLGSLNLAAERLDVAIGTTSLVFTRHPLISIAHIISRSTSLKINSMQQKRGYRNAFPYYTMKPEKTSLSLKVGIRFLCTSKTQRVCHEIIARHALKNAVAGEFDSSQILNVWLNRAAIF